MGSTLKSETLGIFLALLGALLMGLYPVAVRAIYSDGANTAFLVITTLWTRALMPAVYCLLTKKPLFETRENITQSLRGGLGQALSTSSIIAALAFTPSPIVFTIGDTSLLILLFVLAWKKEIKLDALTLNTTLATMVGLSFATDIWHPQPVENLWGIGLAFLGANAIVYRLYIYGKETKKRNPAVVGAENFLIAAIVSSLFMLIKGPIAPTSLQGYGWTAIACLTTSLSTTMMFYSISHIGSFTWNLFDKAGILFTALFSIWLLDEVLTPTQYIGIALVVGSLVAYQVLKKRREALV